MHFEYCPHCGSKLIKKEIGDEGLIPFCEKCNVPLWDMFTTSIIAAVVNEEKEIALIRQNYVSTTNYVCIAGIMKIGESAEETVIREVKEEIGLDVIEVEFIKSYPYEKKEMLMLGYKASVKRADFVISGEVDSVKWVKYEDALNLLREGSIAWQLVKNVIGENMIKITAMTTMCADIFDATGEIFPGGEALNFAAVACGYPYINVGIMGAIGDDECGKAVLDSIRDKSIDKSSIHIIKNGVTASNRIYLTPEGDRYFKDDSWNSGVYGDFRMSGEDIEVLKGSDIVFINYYCPNLADVLKLREMNSFKLAVDFDEVRNFDELEKIVPYIDFFFISGDEGILPVLKKWSEEYDGIFNVTLAENGSVTFFNGKEYRVKAVPVTEIVDTTGCGDSYHAAFICSYVKDNDIISAMNEGSVVASKTLAHIGGF